MRKQFLTFFFLSIAAVLTAAAPPSRHVSDSLPSQWSIADSSISEIVFEQVMPDVDQWWEELNDQKLDSLIALAVSQNYNLEVAANRMQQARAAMYAATAQFYPSIKMEAGWTKEQTSGTSTPYPREIDSYFTGALQMNWELDLFGSIRNRFKAQKASFYASKEEYVGVMVALAAQVGSAYVNLRASQELLRVLNENAESQLKILKIVQARFDAGLTSLLDVAQAKSVYSSTKSSIPPVQTSIEGYIGAIAVLVGEYPQQMRECLMQSTPMPNRIIPVTIGMPISLLMRRPDIRQAEKEIDAQTALLGASKSDWLPQIIFTGSVGFESHQMNNLFKEKSLTYEIAPVLSWTLFSGTSRIQATREAKASLQESVNNFNQLLLTAVQETDQAMMAYRYSIKQIVALREVKYQGEEVLSLSMELYKEGLSDFQNVLDAQRSLLNYESQLVQAQNNSLQQLITLYRALGGGWNYSLEP